MIDAYASERHHAEHIVPVWQALKPRYRGTFYAGDVVGDLAKYGLEKVASGRPGPSERPILVSASGAFQVAKYHGRQNIAMMEHGSGQSFGGDMSSSGRLAAQNMSYAGGLGRDAELFLFPGPHPAARERAARPDTHIEVVGSPRLDALPARVPDGIPTVAVSFHWDTNLSPETRSTFIYYREHLRLLAEDAARSGSFRVLGHAHPRIFDRIASWYTRRGIEPVRDFEDVCRRADVYACDGVSTLYEFASTGRPVIVLNAPFYRRSVEHGLRFWSASHVGQNVDEPSDLQAAVIGNLKSDRWAERREDALSMVYAYRTGAGERAARVLEAWSRRIRR